MFGSGYWGTNDFPDRICFKMSFSLWGHCITILLYFCKSIVWLIQLRFFFFFYHFLKQEFLGKPATAMSLRSLKTTVISYAQRERGREREPDTLFLLFQKIYLSVKRQRPLNMTKLHTCTGHFRIYVEKIMKKNRKKKKWKQRKQIVR